mgnify:FL=1
MASTIQVDTIKDIGGNTMLSSNGSGTITGLPASAVSSGTIATARLGSGTASSSTFLRGDQTYAAAGGGKVLQVVNNILSTTFSMNSGTTADVTGMTPSITLASSTSRLLVLASYGFRVGGSNNTTSPSANVFITDSSDVVKVGTYILNQMPTASLEDNFMSSQMAIWTPGASGSYQVKIRCNNNGLNGVVQFYASNGTATNSTSMTLIELEA